MQDSEWENKDWKVRKGETWSQNAKLRRIQKIGMALVIGSVIAVFTGTVDHVFSFVENVVSPILACVMLFYFFRWLFK